MTSTNPAYTYYEFTESKDKSWYQRIPPKILMVIAIVLIIAIYLFRVQGIQDNKTIIILIGIGIIISFLGTQSSPVKEFLTLQEAMAILRYELKNAIELRSKYNISLEDGEVIIGQSNRWLDLDQLGLKEWHIGFCIRNNNDGYPYWYKAKIDALKTGVGLAGLLKLREEWRGDEIQVRLIRVPISEAPRWQQVGTELGHGT
jgi:hypothetical protein